MIRAKYIMRHGAAVKPNTPATTIVSRLFATGLPGLCVTNEESEVIGVVTEFDILGALREGMNLDSFTAERIMTKDPVTADFDTTTHELIKMMLVSLGSFQRGRDRRAAEGKKIGSPAFYCTGEVHMGEKANPSPLNTRNGDLLGNCRGIRLKHNRGEKGEVDNGKKEIISSSVGCDFLCEYPGHDGFGERANPRHELRDS